MAENQPKTMVKKKLKKKLFHMGLSMVKPLLWLGAILLVADGGALAALLYTYETGGVAVTLWSSLFTALTTAFLLLTALALYRLCGLRAKVTLHLLADVKDLLIKTEQTIHHHLQERQEKETLQEILTEVNRLREQMENLHTDQ